MNADRDDAPLYIQRRGWIYSIKIWAIPVIAGSFVTLSLLHLASNSLLNKSGPNTAEMQVRADISGQIVRVPKTAIEARREDSSTDNSHLWKSENRAETHAKQTVFNDRNYIPRDADNIISMAEPKNSFASPHEENKKRKINITIIGERHDIKESACWPHREGSIEKRNCKAEVGLSTRNRN